MKKKTLEIALSSVEPPDNPSAVLEQYSTPSAIAADILYIAYSSGDIEGKSVADLGCGTGMFSIGAVLMGAKHVVGVDTDAGSLKKAEANVGKFPELKPLTEDRLEFLRGNVAGFDRQVDTVLMNPPFGAQNRGADRPFLEAALKSARVVYSLHNGGTEAFVEKTANKMRAGITLTKNYKFSIPFMFKFHRKEKIEIDVTMFRMEKMNI